MNSDILLLSETWTMLRDTFELNGFDPHHLISDLSRRRPSGVSIYIKHHLKPLVERVEMFPNQDLGIHVHHLPLYIQVPWEKTRLRTADPTEDDDPRQECGPDPWNLAAQINWEGYDDGYPMQHSKQ
ncbi:ATP-dependent DNA helicase [Caerostris extrusa]|uniref:ATP-dependent DNA helicase n=1 Tax=Caerostris extrusa TaxID=172846 RepID=A0AAV4RV97_CAEEX|nr:ATP-dependent DNA helicase [Caerostris extrusa]